MNSPSAAILRSLSSTPNDPGLPQTIRENTENLKLSETEQFLVQNLKMFPYSDLVPGL